MYFPLQLVLVLKPRTPSIQTSVLCTLDKFRCTTTQPSAFWMKASTLPTVCATFIVITVIILVIIIVIIMVIIAMMVLVLQLPLNLVFKVKYANFYIYYPPSK